MRWLRSVREEVLRVRRKQLLTVKYGSYPTCNVCGNMIWDTCASSRRSYCFSDCFDNRVSPVRVELKQIEDTIRSYDPLLQSLDADIQKLKEKEHELAADLNRITGKLSEMRRQRATLQEQQQQGEQDIGNILKKYPTVAT